MSRTDTYVRETGTVWTDHPIDWSTKPSQNNWKLDTRRTEYDDMSGGDYIEDQKEWLKVKVGERLPAGVATA